MKTAIILLLCIAVAQCAPHGKGKGIMHSKMGSNTAIRNQPWRRPLRLRQIRMLPRNINNLLLPHLLKLQLPLMLPLVINNLLLPLLLQLLPTRPHLTSNLLWLLPRPLTQLQRRRTNRPLQRRPLRLQLPLMPLQATKNHLP
jgi:hypothetical protein